MPERYYFRIIGDSKMHGPDTLDGIKAIAKPLRYYEAVPAIGQTYAQLRKTKDWVRADSLLSCGVDDSATPEITDTTHCHVFYGGQQHGPYTPQQIKTMWSAGTLTADTSVLPAGYSDWLPMSDFLKRLQLHNASTANPPPVSRSLAIALTVLGVVLTIYFAAFYDTSVRTERRYIPELGYVGGETVVNLAKQQNRLIGVIVGVAMSVIGIVVVCLPAKPNDAS